MTTWRRWVALLEQQETGTSLALFRIAIGACVLYGFGALVPAGLPGVLWVDRAHGGYRSLGAGTWLVELLGGPTPLVAWGLTAGALLGGAALVAGVGTRLAALVTLQLALALTWLNGHAGGSYDDLLTNALWLLVLARSDATLSLSCRLRTGAWTSTRPVSSWPRWLAVLQLVVMYASTGSQKLSAHWLPGGDLSALYYILQQPSWQRADMRWVAGLYPLTQGLTLLTWLWEVSAPLLLAWFWARRREAMDPDGGGGLRAALRRFDLRLPFTAVGVGMHLGTLALLDVGPFSPLSLAFYLALWHPDEVASAWSRVRRGAASARR